MQTERTDERTSQLNAALRRIRDYISRRALLVIVFIAALIYFYSLVYLEATTPAATTIPTVVQKRPWLYQILPRPNPSATRQKFYAIWSARDGKRVAAMPEKMRLSLGSLFFHHPWATFTMYSNDLEDDIFSDFTSQGYNIVTQRFDLLEVFRNCAPNPEFPNWAMNGTFLRQGAQNHEEHIADALRLCFSYIHGGVYMDMDVFIIRPIDYTDGLAFLSGVGSSCPVPPYELECSSPRETTITFAGETVQVPEKIYFSTGFFALSAQSKFARATLEHMVVYDDPSCWNCIGPKTFAHVYKYMTPEAEKPPLLRSCDDRQGPLYEVDTKTTIAERWERIRLCPYSHLYSSASKLVVPANSLFAELVRDMTIGCERFLPS